MKSNEEELEEIFLKTPTFATEKLDGTNIAKDNTGQVYSRRLELGPADSHFLKTPLTQVREADIEMFRQNLCLTLGLEEERMERVLVYGELMCNSYYDYRDRGLHADWRVFGACLVVRPRDKEDILQALMKEDFSSEPLSGNSIQILPCPRLFEVALASGLKVVPVMAENKTLAQIITDNQTLMKMGRMEGIIFTIHSTKFGFNILKWKGKYLNYVNLDAKSNKLKFSIWFRMNCNQYYRVPFFVPPYDNSLLLNRIIIFLAGAHEHQTNALNQVSEARDKLEKISSNKELNKVFDILGAVLIDTEENIQIQKKKQGPVKKRKGKTPSDKYLTQEDINIIINGVQHSQTKFDCIENYERKTYLSLLKTEVRRHFIEEKNITDKFTENDNVIKFISAMVEKITQ